MREYRFRRLALVLTGMLISNSSLAVMNNGLLPGYLNPANISNELSTQVESSVAKKKNVLDIEPVSSTPSTSVTAESQFVLKKIVLTGNTMPIPAAVTAVYQGALNQPIDFAGLQQLAEKMQNAYRRIGYFLVRVVLPPQTVFVKKGEVVFHIIEGEINQVRFTGDIPPTAKAQLERYAQVIEDENPITYANLDRFLTLVNNLPGIDATATLIPNPKVLGSADLEVNVTEQKLSAFINFNNLGTPYIGPGQLLAGASIYNLLGADALSLSGATTTSNTNELHYVNAGYEIVVGNYGTEINPSIISTQTRPGGRIAPFDLYGNSMQYNLAVDQPLIASLTQNLTLETELSHLNNTNTAFANSFTIFDDSITTLMAGLNYQGLFWHSYNNISLTTTVGMPILGAPSNLSNPSRVNGTNQFIAFNLNTSTVHYLTQRLSFLITSAFQLTPNPLLSSEQIGYGGSAFGQAFVPYMISGDNGMMGAIALRYDLPAPGMIRLLQPEVFLDGGLVTDNDSIAGSPNSASASSAGIGLNMQISRNWQIQATLAKPVSINHATNVYGSGWQALINLTALI